MVAMFGGQSAVQSKSQNINWPREANHKPKAEIEPILEKARACRASQWQRVSHAILKQNPVHAAVAKGMAHSLN